MYARHQKSNSTNAQQLGSILQAVKKQQLGLAACNKKKIQSNKENNKDLNNNSKSTSKPKYLQGVTSRIREQI